jgi:hypothetical protein
MEEVTLADVQLEPIGPQAQWQETFEKLGRSAPAPRADEREADYLRRMARLGRRYIPEAEEIAQVAFDASMPDSAVRTFSEQMRQRVEANLRRTDNLDPNDPAYRTVLVTDPQTNMKIREFYRARPFTDDFGTACRRVTRINAPASMPLYSADRRAMGQIFG